MTLTIELGPAQEASLIAAAMKTGLEPTELVKRLVTSYLPTNGVGTLPPDERIRAMDAFAEENSGLPVLSDAAFDRDDLYEDRL